MKRRESGCFLSHLEIKLTPSLRLSAQLSSSTVLPRKETFKPLHQLIPSDTVFHNTGIMYMVLLCLC